MIPAGVRAIAFDAVGTVLHPRPGAPAVYTELATRIGLDPTGLLDRLRDSYLAEEAVDFAADWQTSEAREIARWRAIVAASLPGSGEPEFQELYQHFARPTAWCAAPNIEAILESLADRGYQIALASNYDSRLNTVLAGRPELARLTEHVVISSEVGVRKPSRLFFAALATRLNCSPAEILFVGDDLMNDFTGAQEAGLHAVLLDPAAKKELVSPRIRNLTDLVTG